MVVLSVVVCVCVCVGLHDTQPAGTVALSCENFYNGDVHFHERLLVYHDLP